jgi:hypothetical protein
MRVQLQAHHHHANAGDGSVASVALSQFITGTPAVAAPSAAAAAGHALPTYLVGEFVAALVVAAYGIAALVAANLQVAQRVAVNATAPFTAFHQSTHTGSDFAALPTRARIFSAAAASRGSAVA